MESRQFSRSTVKTILLMVISTVFAISIAQQMKETVTPLLFAGKLFGNRSPIVQMGILLVITMGIYPCIYTFLKYIYPDAILSIFHEWIVKPTRDTNDFAKTQTHPNSIGPVPFSLVVAFTYLSTFFYVIMEWVFFITKPSFLDSLEPWEKALTLLQTNVSVFLPILTISLVFIPINQIRHAWVQNTTRAILFLVAGIILTITFLLLVDNFTYTLTGFGIVKSKSGWRAVYLVGAILFLLATYQRVTKAASRIKRGKWFLLLASSIFMISTISLLFGFLTRSEYSRGVTPNGPLRTPNIVMVGTDALDASHLSFYGYNRDTTPFINSMLDSALVMQNHFSNANNSAGSVGSIFNSKLPTRTKVAKHPDAFKGKDAYEHLPGILMDLGYRNYEITYAIYEDAVNLNFKRGFHKASGVNLEQNLLSLIYGKFLPDPAQFFIDELTERARDRLLHITFIRKMADPFATINEPTFDDSLIRMPELLRVISESRQPYFIHAHLLGTHGPTYAPSSDAYSSGDLQTDDWMPDFYDDAIRDFDGYLKEIFDALAQTGQLDNTMVILYTDHTRTRDSLEKIPSVIWFPKQEYTGKVLENTNNLDLSPTILDYIGLQKPGWMEGSSMISGNLDRYRPIYGAIWRRPQTPGGKPPYFEFGNFRITVCQKYVDYATIQGKWTWGYIRNYINPCPLESLPTLEEMQDILIDRIAGDGYDPSIMDQNRR